MPSRYGRQPGLDILNEECRNLAAVARVTGEKYAHASKSLLGKHRPRPEFVQKLSELLKREPEELWTSEILAEPFRPRVRGRK
ncbi:hypothetical protein Pen02_82910 [Plantactinospora endophytica]|uniref:Transcriptional regulator n=1 Tax=Plantactinospora endophytica TaxID=673535 RepID=A0ABQ4EF54_9ACTN|nr:hypothetical protein Pen02_82910 [Plantactinospora endophytica]